MIGIDLAAGPASTAITMLQVGAGKSIHIGTIVQIFDLRGEDPDRAMVAWVEPIERLARQQGASAI